MAIINRILAFFGIINKSSDTAAVVIGVENGKYGACPGAGVDSSRMATLLKKYTNDVTLLQNKDATQANVMNALSKGAQKDLLIVYYSGHGGQAGKGDPSEADGKDEYLCLYNGALYDNNLWQIINQAKRTFLIFDCCHSETMFRAIQAQANKVSAMSGGTPTMLCWSGCPDSTYSYGDATGGQFTNALLKAYSPSLSYNQVWTRICNNCDLMRYQAVRKTQYGKWNNVVFK